MATATSTGVISLRRIERTAAQITVRGLSPLIVNRWSEKAKQQMLDAQQTKARAKKDPKDPVALFEASKYLLADGRDGFPAVGFKAAIVHAARLFEGITQVMVKQSVMVRGEGPQQLVPITYDECIMREDTPRNASGVADLRYRAQYWPWSATIIVDYLENQIDSESLVALVDAAGIGGIGEWRPTSPKSATGTYGRFEVVG